MTTEDAARAERIRRLQSRGAPDAVSGARAVPEAPSDGDMPQGAARRPGHRAEASRVAVAGAGAVVTLSLMAAMAAADLGPEAGAGDAGGEDTAGTPVTAPEVVSAAVAPATPVVSSHVPTVDVPVRDLRTGEPPEDRPPTVTVEEADPAPPVTQQPVTQQPPTPASPPPPAPPPPVTESHGSR